MVTAYQCLNCGAKRAVLLTTLGRCSCGSKIYQDVIISRSERDSLPDASEATRHNDDASRIEKQSMR